MEITSRTIFTDNELPAVAIEYNGKEIKVFTDDTLVKEMPFNGMLPEYFVQGIFEGLKIGVRNPVAFTPKS